MTIARLQAIADTLEKSNIGYDQGNRWSFLDREHRRVKPNTECDCSSSCGGIAWLAGYPVDIASTFWTGNFAAKMKATGLFKAITFTKLSDVRAGDFVVGPGHVVFARTATKWWSAEVDESGKKVGGDAGDQTGKETRYRKPYLRSNGWRYIVRPISPKTFQRRILDAYRAGNPEAVEDALGLLAIRAPWDGPRWRVFMKKWAGLDRGMSLLYAPQSGAEHAPGGRHAFVVLGSALDPTGAITAKYLRRLRLAASALEGDPDSTVIVVGGAPVNGVTEAAAGKAWLVDAGVAPHRIATETKSASTIGNARNTVPLMSTLGVTDYTLVSDASHLRRATVLFHAARLRAETAKNQKLALRARTPLAFNDYGTAPVKPELPIGDQARATVVGEVRALFEL